MDGSGGDEDALSAFTNLGGNGTNGDAAALLGSFTNVSAAGGANVGSGGGDIFGQLATGTLGGLGMGLNMNMGMGINPLGLAGGIGNARAGASGVDLSSIRLMGLNDVHPGSGVAQPAGVAANAAQIVGQLLGAPAASVGLRGASQISSPSSDEMGDIPLAQLAQIQARVPAAPMQAGQGYMGVPPALLLPAGQAPLLQLSAQLPVYGAAVTDAMAALARPAESGTTGVESTVLATRPSSPGGSAGGEQLGLVLNRPAGGATSEAEAPPLAELERIEGQLCALLSMASRTIRMLTGARGTAGADAGIGATVEGFMRTVAAVQADMIRQHRLLAERGIPIQIPARFRSSTAGAERDLANWSDAAALLADALESGLALAAVPAAP
ncbi:hypothetical protein H4R19_002659 [Coemansia spiralis]|nr:hypothetical protein H4R19_002659 [Coemansia spiralis]